MNRFCINVGVSAGDYYIDNIVLSEKVVETRAVTRASGPTIIEKTDEEKSRDYQRCYGRLDFKDGYPLQTLCSCMGRSQ